MELAKADRWTKYVVLFFLGILVGVFAMGWFMTGRDQRTVTDGRVEQSSVIDGRVEAPKPTDGVVEKKSP